MKKEECNEKRKKYKAHAVINVSIYRLDGRGGIGGRRPEAKALIFRAGGASASEWSCEKFNAHSSEATL